MVIDDGIKKEAYRLANNIIDDIENAFKDPSRGLKGVSFSTFDELKVFGFFDSGYESLKQNRKAIVDAIALLQYKSLLGSQEKPKLSKWEMVMGKASRKR